MGTPSPNYNHTIQDNTTDRTSYSSLPNYYTMVYTKDYRHIHNIRVDNTDDSYNMDRTMDYRSRPTCSCARNIDNHQRLLPLYRNTFLQMLYRYTLNPDKARFLF